MFPRGMLAPDLMWEGPPADAVYVHIKSMIFEYWGCLKPTSSRSDHAAARSLGEGRASAPRQERLLTIEVSVLSAGTVTGPVHLEHSDRAGRDQRLDLLQHLSLESDGRRRMTPGMDPAASLVPGGGFPWRRASVAPTASWCAFPPVVRPKCSGRRTATVVTRSRPTVRSCSRSPSPTAPMRYELVANGPAPAPKMAGGSATWAAVVSGRLGVLDHVHGHRRGAHRASSAACRRFGGRDGGRRDDGPADPEHGHSTRRAHALLLPGRDVPRVQRLRHRTGARHRADAVRHQDAHGQRLPGASTRSPRARCVPAGRSCCRTTTASCSCARTTSTSPVAASASLPRSNPARAPRALLGALDHRPRHQDGDGAREGDGLQHAGRRGQDTHVPAVRRRTTCTTPTTRRCRRSPRAATSGCSSTRSATTETSACSGSCGAQRSISRPTAATTRIRAIPPSTCQGRKRERATTARSPRSTRAARTATHARAGSIAAVAFATRPRHPSSTNRWALARR